MRFYTKGKELYEQGDYRKANFELSNALQIDPNFADAYYWRGMSELKRGEAQKAYDNFGSAVEKGPHHLQAHLELGKLFLLARMPEKVEEKLQTVFKQDPNSKDALFLKAKLLLVSDQNGAALETMQSLIQQGYKNVEIYQMVTAVYLDREDLKSAERFLDQGREEFPGSVELMALLANVYDLQHRSADAVVVINKMIEAEPGQEMHKIAMAQLLWKTGQEAESRKFLDAALGKEPDNARLWESVASFYFGQRDPAVAETTLRKGIEANPEGYALRFSLQMLLTQQGRYDEALRILQDCLKLDKTPGASGTLTTWIKLADVYFLQGDIDKSDEHVQLVLKDNPRNVEAMYIKGQIDCLVGNLDNAIAAFRQVTSEQPDFADAYLRLAEAHLRNKQQEMAITALQTARKTLPRDIRIPSALARLYLLKGDKAAVEDLLKDLLVAYPDEQRFKVELGNYYMEQKKYDKAEALFKQIVELTPAIPAGYVKLGELALRQGDAAKAIGVVQRGCRANPDSAVLLEELVKFNLVAERFDAATTACQERIKKNPDDAFAQNLLGQIHLRKKDFRKAEAAFAMALTLQPRWQEPHNNLAVAALMQQKVEIAIEHLRAGIAADPKNTAGYATLGALYQKTGAMDKARGIFEQAVNENPNDWLAANNLAYLLNEQAGDAETRNRALKHARQALRLNPENPTALDTLGWIYQHLGDYRKAQGFIERALELRPDWPLLQFHLGVVFHSMGKRDQARELLEKSLEAEGEVPWKSKAREILNQLSEERVGGQG